MKILGIILLVIIIGAIVYYITQLKDKDGDGDIDLKDAKLTAKDIEKDLKAGVKETKRRAKNVKENQNLKGWVLLKKDMEKLTFNDRV